MQHVCAYRQAFSCWTNQQRINNHFLEWNRSLTPTCAGLLEFRGSGCGLLKSTFHAENFICRLSWFISSDFCAIHSWNAYYSPELQKKSLKPPIWGVKGHSRSSMLTFPRSSSLVLVMISNMSVKEYFHAQLRSGYCARLNSYNDRLNAAVPDICPDCNTTPHSVAHLFECPMHQTDLTPVDLWQWPKEVAEFFNAWPEQDGGWATTTATAR